MMTGVITAEREARLRLMLRGPDGREAEVDAAVDTGFTHALMLSSALIVGLALPFLTVEPMVVAGGAVVHFDVYEGTVLWHGERRAIRIHAGEGDALAGMGLLYGNNLNMDVVDGAAFTIEALE